MTPRIFRRASDFYIVAAIPFRRLPPALPRDVPPHHPLLRRNAAEVAAQRASRAARGCDRELGEWPISIPAVGIALRKVETPLRGVPSFSSSAVIGGAPFDGGAPSGDAKRDARRGALVLRARSHRAERGGEVVRGEAADAAPSPGHLVAEQRDLPLEKGGDVWNDPLGDGGEETASVGEQQCERHVLRLGAQLSCRCWSGHAFFAGLRAPFRDFWRCVTCRSVMTAVWRCRLARFLAARGEDETPAAAARMATLL
eukprot:gene1493-biopygen5222